jgi:hypothetical protein
MKFLVATAVLVAAIASPVLAQTNTQAVNKPLIFAQAAPSSAPAVAVRKTKKTGKVMVKGKAEHCAKASDDVVVDNVFIGCDPDPQVRSDMMKEYNETQ